MRLNLQTDEGRALAVILSVLGEHGRSVVRTALLDASVSGLTDAKHTLDMLNEIERAFDQRKRNRKD